MSDVPGHYNGAVLSCFKIIISEGFVHQGSQPGDFDKEHSEVALNFVWTFVNANGSSRISLSQFMMDEQYPCLPILMRTKIIIDISFVVYDCV